MTDWCICLNKDVELFVEFYYFSVLEIGVDFNLVDVRFDFAPGQEVDK